MTESTFDKLYGPMMERAGGQLYLRDEGFLAWYDSIWYDDATVIGEHIKAQLESNRLTVVESTGQLPTNSQSNPKATNK